MPAGAKASFVAIRSAGAIVALLPMVLAAGRLGSLTTPYTCEYTPLFAAGLGQAARIEAMATFGTFCRAYGVVRPDALPAEWEGWADLEAGIRQAGLQALRFAHFGNWHEDVAGLDWAAYMLGRSGALRETIRRRLRRAERLPDARFDLLTEPAQMDGGMAAFESVYRRSWKDTEPFPAFNAAFIRAMSASGWLRLGVWSIGGEPVAVQFWVVKDGRAIVLKLAHDEAFKAHSPGTVLTALMLRHMLDREHVAEIDFGRGDDAYKQGWATQRRQRVGLLLVNPWRIAGLAEILRHAAGRVRNAVRNGPGAAADPIGTTVSAGGTPPVRRGRHREPQAMSAPAPPGRSIGM
jgi:CelD/BcsL family acetyltransferase involved in cellulose biosynthesis